MVYGKSFSQYKRSNIETAGKLDLVVMCYEKAILSLNQAKSLFMQNEYEKKGKKIQNVLDIINELQCNLNIEKGGTIAKNLDSIYSYLTARILKADIEKDLKALDECAGILGELKGAWDEISHGGRNENPVPVQKIRPVSGLTERLAVSA